MRRDLRRHTSGSCGNGEFAKACFLLILPAFPCAAPRVYED